MTQFIVLARGSLGGTGFAVLTVQTLHLLELLLPEISEVLLSILEPDEVLAEPPVRGQRTLGWVLG